MNNPAAERTATDSPWKLRFDLVFIKLLLWIAGAGRIGDPTPDVHRYLADRYIRLARYHEDRKHQSAALRLWGFAQFHLQFASIDPDDMPPAAALAMPIPKRPIFTNAIARWHTEGPSDDAA